jgi:hypothetical protein
MWSSIVLRMINQNFGANVAILLVQQFLKFTHVITQQIRVITNIKT